MLSTDRVVHELYETSEIRDAVVERYGPEVVRDGTVDRAAVAQRAFAIPDSRAWLEELLWPRVGERMVRWRQELETASRPPRAAVVEVPLLFESGMATAFDATIAVVADEDLRAERAGARGHEALAERSARQFTQEEKSQRATYTVVNDGTTEQLERKLSDVLAILER